MSDMHHAGFGHADGSGRIGAVLDKLYGGLVEPDQTRAGMDAVRHLFGVDHLAVICRSADVPTSVSTNLICDDTPRRDFESNYVKSFCFVDPFINLPFDQPLIVQEFMDERAWEAHQFFQEFLQPMNVFHVMGADILTGPGTVYSVRLCRSRAAPRFTADDISLFHMMLPHLRRFGQLQTRIGHAQAVESVLDALTAGAKLGAMILDGSSKVVHSAGLAEARLSTRKGFYLSSGRLHASSRANDQKLQRMLQFAASTGDDGVAGETQVARMESENGSLGVALHSLPLPRGLNEKPQIGTMVVFRDLDSETEIPEEGLKRLFGFTAAEARLARLLAMGLSIDEAAEQLRVSRNTLRTHLRALFVKTGTARQSELMRMLVSSTAVLC